jgi:hypothetical protein
MTTEAVPNEVPNDCITAPGLVSKVIENDVEHNHQDLTATDISAERLHMDIEHEDYWKPNWTKPLLEMFTEWHTEGSRNNGRKVYRIIKQPWPNSIPNVVTNFLAGGLPKYYHAANGYSTEAAY